MYKTRIEKHKHRVWLLNRKIKKLCLNRRFKKPMLLPTRRYLLPTLWSITLLKLRLYRKKVRTKAVRHSKVLWTPWSPFISRRKTIIFCRRRFKVSYRLQNSTPILWV